MRTPESKIFSRRDLSVERDRLREEGKTVVFTNGCFDLFHAGHAATFQFAREQGDVVIVGINSDDSMKRLKGPKRPLLAERHRAAVVAAMESVDYVVIFDETEVLPLIEALKPNVLVKGQDREGDVVGQEFVESYGGRVAMAPLVEGLSTSELIKRVLDAYGCS